ncbi:MAG: hypothetical protein WCB68_15625 [Pyrinomonadaceae bacterium]
MREHWALTPPPSGRKEVTEMFFYMNIMCHCTMIVVVSEDGATIIILIA